MQLGLIYAAVKSDSVPIEGATTLLCTGAGDLVLKGTQPGATALPAFAVAVGAQIYVPGECYIMDATTATFAVMG